MDKPAKVIGLRTTYIGSEHPYLRGQVVQVIAVLKHAAAGPEGEGEYLTDDEAIAQAGGVGPDDRLEVQPWLEEEGRFSFVSSDARAVDLEAFVHIATRAHR